MVSRWDDPDPVLELMMGQSKRYQARLASRPLLTQSIGSAVSFPRFRDSSTGASHLQSHRSSRSDTETIYGRSCSAPEMCWHSSWLTGSVLRTTITPELPVWRRMAVVGLSFAKQMAVIQPLTCELLQLSSDRPPRHGTSLCSDISCYETRRPL